MNASDHRKHAPHTPSPTEDAIRNFKNDFLFVFCALRASSNISRDSNAPNTAEKYDNTSRGASHSNERLPLMLLLLLLFA